MPALRSGRSAKEDSKSSNMYKNSIGGSGDGEEASYLKKKSILLEENGLGPQQQQWRSNDGNNNSQEDTFADTYTVSSAKHQDESISVFGRRDEEVTSIGQSAKDQFAVALLKLQTDLEATSRRLADLEGKLDRHSNNLQQQQKQQQASRARDGGKGPAAFNNVTNILYLTWPVLVFFAMRAIEKRSISAKLA